jgi:hypothetical protein
MSDLRVLIVRPSGHLELMLWERSNLLRSFQASVGGYIEAIGGPGWSAYCNEEGKLQNLPFNPQAQLLAEGHGWTPLPFDTLVGTVVFVGPPDSDGEDTDVPDFLVRAVGL